HRAFHQILRSSSPEGWREGASHPQPRSDRSGADALRWIPRTRRGAGGPRMGREPADVNRVHAARPALVPGQHAVLAVSLAHEAEACKSLSIDAGHRDVHRLSRMDRATRAGHHRAGIIRQSRSLHASRSRQCPLRMDSPDVVRAEDCDLCRLSAPPGCPPGIRRQRPHHREFCNRDRLFDRALSHPLDQPHDLSRWVAIALVSATQPAALPYVLFLAAGPALAVPFAMLTAWPSLGSLAVQIGIGRLPEETATPHELLLLSLPAISAAAQPAASGPV